MCLAWFRCVRNSYWILSFGEHRNIRIHRSTGVPEHRSTGVLEYRSAGTSEYWNPGKARFRLFWKPLHFCSLLRGFNYSSVPGFRGFNYSDVPRFRGFIIFLGEHWRVPDAELYLKETFIFEFCFRVCGHTLIPH